MNYNEILFKLLSEGLCRAIAWDAIVVGVNKQGGKLSGDNYVKAIYLGSIIRGQQIVWTPIVLGLIIWGAITGKAIFFGGMQLSWGYYCPGGNYPRG